MDKAIIFSNPIFIFKTINLAPVTKYLKHLLRSKKLASLKNNFVYRLWSAPVE